MPPRPKLLVGRRAVEERLEPPVAAARRPQPHAGDRARGVGSALAWPGGRRRGSLGAGGRLRARRAALLVVPSHGASLAWWVALPRFRPAVPLPSRGRWKQEEAHAELSPHRPDDPRVLVSVLPRGAASALPAGAASQEGAARRSPAHRAAPVPPTGCLTRRRLSRGLMGGLRRAPPSS